ncbi:hypothetical protein [Escherichia fergusonii]|uniref:hypothetical protein n=1 Tax=Escherichia fergusonii TaxID=564 RepID=UPI002921E778|nr:hypothetical protein Ef22C057LT_44720 [Escherichia fergusonii]
MVQISIKFDEWFLKYNFPAMEKHLSFSVPDRMLSDNILHLASATSGGAGVLGAGIWISR